MKFSPYRMFALLGLLALGGCAGSNETDSTDTVSSTETDPSGNAGDDVANGLSLERQVAIIEQRLEATNTQNWDLWESLHTADAIRTAPELEEPLRGAPAMRAAIETLGTAFPDYHLELQQAFGQGPWLAVRLHTTGTMTGPLTLSDGVVVPPTGQSIEQDWSALVRFEGDHIAEFHEFYDQLLLMVQLGLITPP
jgi:predicted ester cyclase